MLTAQDRLLPAVRHCERQICAQRLVLWQTNGSATECLVGEERPQARAASFRYLQTEPRKRPVTEQSASTPASDRMAASICSFTAVL